nr:hypothetical protein [Tanacetum cinerariifolium]
ALVTLSRATVTVSSTYEVGGPSTAMSVRHTLTTMASGVATQPQMIDDLCVRMSDLEYRHEELVKKMVKVSDAKVTDSITIGEIHPQGYCRGEGTCDGITGSAGSERARGD